NRAAAVRRPASRTRLRTATTTEAFASCARPHRCCSALLDLVNSLHFIDNRAPAFYNALDKLLFLQETRSMAKQQDEVNKSQAVRDLLAQNRKMKASKVISTL